MNMMQPDGIFGALKAGCYVSELKARGAGFWQRFAGIRRRSIAALLR